MPTEAKEGAVGVASADLKAYAGFLSHFKFECGTEARLVQQNLKPIIEQNPLAESTNEIFLDSDDLSDLRNLLEYVKDTKVLVLLQSKRVLQRPWVILELYTAITNQVPIVSLNVKNSYPYDYSEAMEFLLHFDEEIEVANPGAAELLIDMGVDPVDVAWRLSDSLPNIISTDFNPNASEKVLQASLEDLVISMQKAVPIAPSSTKEEWLEKRKANKSTASKKAHGSADAVSSGDATDVSSPAKGLATVPTTVPELPNAYLVRDEDIAQLKGALLGKSASGSTALTSKAGAKKSNKVAGHGMGGVGKTTIAAALVNDEEVRRSFEKILWVSIGQEPDLRELQDSLHLQLTDASLPDTIKTDGEVSAALRNASAKAEVLLVLDDVWDAAHEKLLNCVNSDNASRILVTTRIRGLLKNSAEVDVGVLSGQESLQLLLSSADMDVGDVEEDSDEYRIAMEIVELCGKLPLTLAIAGGMISDNPDGFSDEVVELMKEDRLREQEDEDEMTLEERVISSSLKMIKGKNKDLILSIFEFFAVFAEDVPVPAGFFNVFAPMLTGEKKEKKAKLLVGNCLTMLLKYNLIKGSLSAGHGVFQHDIVRDYVINKHMPEQLIARQKEVVETILAARPGGIPDDLRPQPNEGFPMPELVSAATFNGYVARNLFYHIRGALDDGEEPPDAWLIFVDAVVKKNVAVGVGIDTLKALADSREAAGNLVGAAKCLPPVCVAQGSLERESVELLYRAAAMLEKADEAEAYNYEIGLTMALFQCDMGTERHKHTMARGQELMKLVGGEETEDAAAEMAQAGLKIPEAMGLLGFFGGETNLDETFKVLAWASLKFQSAATIEPCPTTYVNWGKNLGGANCWGIIGGICKEGRDAVVKEFAFSEKQICDGIDNYEVSVDSQLFREQWHFDAVPMGCFLPMLTFLFGNIQKIDVWYEKTKSFWETADLATSKDYASYTMECWDGMAFGAVNCLYLGLNEKADSLLKLVGFTWDGDGSERIDTFTAVQAQIFPSVQPKIESAWIRMMMFLASPPDAVDQEQVLAWLPTPAALAEMEASDAVTKRMGIHDVTSFGARCYLRIGRDDDAYEVARLACLPEQKTEKQTTLISSYSILGQVAAKRGDLDEADGHFAKALGVAKLSPLPLFEVFAARDWKKYLLEPNGRDCGPADAAIDAACAKMNKTREELERVL